MMDWPAGFVVVGCEKRIVDSITDFYNGASNEFTKAFLVTDLFAKGDTADEYYLLAQGGDLEDLTCIQPSVLRGISKAEMR